MLWRLLGKYSQLALTNKLLVYKTIIRPIWTYRLELWGSAHPSNVHPLQVGQSKILRIIVNAPFYVSNHTLHKNLKIPFLTDQHSATESAKASKKAMAPGSTAAQCVTCR